MLKCKSFSTQGDENYTSARPPMYFWPRVTLTFDLLTNKVGSFNVPICIQNWLIRFQNIGFASLVGDETANRQAMNIVLPPASLT